MRLLDSKRVAVFFARTNEPLRKVSATYLTDLDVATYVEVAVVHRPFVTDFALLLWHPLRCEKLFSSNNWWCPCEFTGQGLTIRLASSQRHYGRTNSYPLPHTRTDRRRRHGSSVSGARRAIGTRCGHQGVAPGHTPRRGQPQAFPQRGRFSRPPESSQHRNHPCVRDRTPHRFCGQHINGQAI